MSNTDWRYLANGRRIPTESGYADQPSLVKMKSGAWVCSVTTGSGEEGAKGQYVNITRSVDRGVTWSEPIALEDVAWESAYSSLAVAPSGNLYCFYCHNLDHIDIDEAGLHRYDMGGHYCYRISVDEGVTWSDRKVVPIRDFLIDAEQEHQTFRGTPLRFFWNVSRVFFDGDTFYSPIIKYIYKSDDIIHRSEGVLLRCVGLDICPDAQWETLPDGDVGLRTPAGGGRVAEEQSFVKLSDGSLYCTYRTIDGHPASSVSRDGGHTFEPPKYLQYADGRTLKHNRAATFIWPLKDRKYLYWFNNHMEKWYPRRNPIWCALAVETPTPGGITLTYSQPEILMYHETPRVGMSYPDLLEDDGIWYVTETQKTEARVHPIDSHFIDTLMCQFDGCITVADRPVYSFAKRENGAARFPRLPFLSANPLSHRIGYTVSLWFTDAKAGEVLFDAGSIDGGLCISLDGEGRLQALVGEQMANCMLVGCAPLNDGHRHHAALLMDVSANIMYFVIDGLFDDGGAAICGWRFMNRNMLDVPPCDSPKTANSLQSIDLYDRSMLTCETAELYRMGYV